MKDVKLKHNLSDIPIAFIVTRGRSGSTLLQSTLDAHPNICAPNEADFVLYLKSKYAKSRLWNASLITKFINDLYSNRRYRLFWKVKKSDLIELFSRFTINNFPDACKVVYLSSKSPFHKDEISLIVDKNPVHAHYIPLLKEFFPEAKFIHLVRDPRAVANSVRNSFNRKNIHRIAKSWVRANYKIETEKTTEKFITVKYENLVAAPETELKKILTFLGQDFYDNMLDSHKILNEIKEKHANYSLEHHKNIGKQISDSFVEKWKTQLSEDEIKAINYITYKDAGKYGYIIEKPELDPKKQKEINALSNRTFLRFKKTFYYNLPLFVRKSLLNIISFFSDKKYQK